MVPSNTNNYLKCKLPPLTPQNGNLKKPDDVLTNADVDENIYSDIQQVAEEAEYSVIPQITIQN